MSKEEESNRFQRARLTIQECSFPNNSNSHKRQASTLSTKKISFAYLSTNFDKKHSLKTNNPEVQFSNKKINTYMKEQRKSHQLADEVVNNLINLPVIKKSIREYQQHSARDKEQNKGIEPIKSFSSTKLGVNPYHKI